MGREPWKQNLGEHATATRDSGGWWPCVPDVPAPGEVSLCQPAPTRPSLCTKWAGGHLEKDKATVPQSHIHFQIEMHNLKTSMRRNPSVTRCNSWVSRFHFKLRC